MAAATGSSNAPPPQTSASLKSALSAGQVEELDGLFQVFELKAGFIHCSDLPIAFQMLGTQMPKEQVQAFITLYSADGKHFTKEEFFEIAGEVILSKDDNDKEQKLGKAYDLFDLHGSGSVTAKQLHRVLSQLNQVTGMVEAGGVLDDISEESLESLIKDLDEDGLGITKHMFIEMLKGSASIL